MVRIATIVDCYTVEPSGLGVPPYLSTYARAAFGALTHAYPPVPTLRRPRHERAGRER
jgi:radical SAM superfamily enzyme with C-terminal helix-hairpin-helix motif